MALTKISRSLLDTGISDSSDATAITINSSEQVGIGVSPSATLQVKAASGNTGLYLQDAAGSPNISWLDAGGTVQWQVYSTMGGANGLDPLVIYSSAGEVARIDTSGNIGIGTTTINSGTLGSSNTFLEVAAGTASGSGTLILSRNSSTNDVELGGVRFVNANNADDDGLDADGKLVAAMSARSVTSDSNAGDDSGANLVFYTKPEAGSYAERLRITSDGDVGIGDAAPADKLEVNGGSSYPHIRITSSSNTSRYMRIGMASATDHVIEANGTSSLLYFKTSGSERMRIDASGLMQMGTTGKTGRINLQPNPTNNHFVEFYSTVDSKVGEINTSTGVQTNYVTSSDYRLKENIVPMEKGLERVNKLKPVKFNWKNDGTISEGFIAHEVQEAGWNEGVIGKKDSEEMQMVDYAKLTPLLVKAIQEQQEQIEELKKEIETLKN